MTDTPSTDNGNENITDTAPADATPSGPAFSDFALDPRVMQAVTEIGYETPSPIQAQALPSLLDGKDLLGQAQTGTGKTAAFALPLLSRIDHELRRPQILVMTPTRELAIQVAEAMQSYARHLPDFHVLPVYGGQPMHLQLKPLRRGVHAIVGTPGRVLDHLKRGTLDTSGLSAVVLDEADEMLRMGFIDDIQAILDHTPPERQLALFSATMPKPIQRVADGYLNDPVHVRIKTKATTVDTIDQGYLLMRGIGKLDALTRVLETESFDAAILFVRTKNSTTDLAEKLEARGYACAALNGDMNQAHREQTVERLRKGSLDLVIATDVAARGLDVERISLVINFDIPNDPESYVHRIGRTGRAGAKGKAILFISPRERRTLGLIERVTRSTIKQLNVPSVEHVDKARKQRFLASLGETIENQDLSTYREVIEDYLNESDHSALDVAAALAQIGFKEQLTPFVPERSAKKRDNERKERDNDWGEKRAPRERGERHERARPVDDGMERYVIQVGRDHDVEIRNIVGAIANEAELDAEHIGYIKLNDQTSTVDLPEGMPREIRDHLQTVWVAGQQLRIQLADEQPSGKMRHGKPRHKPDHRTGHKSGHGPGRGPKGHKSHKGGARKGPRPPRHD